MVRGITFGVAAGWTARAAVLKNAVAAAANAAHVPAEAALPARLVAANDAVKGENITFLAPRLLSVRVT